ncbi:MAG: hypothetical protein HC817_14395 [Saprospiraceae bacterium]|nr:hypothetical protein [Saprospiraceae bacterium]
MGFLMYIADATGYLASIGVMFSRNFGAKNLTWLSFFLQLSYGVAVVGFVLVVLSGYYFYVKLKSLSVGSKQPRLND